MARNCLWRCGVIVFFFFFFFCFSRFSRGRETHFAAVSGVHVLSSNNEVWPALDSWQGKEERNTVEENALVTRERRILGSRDCEQTRVKQGPFDTPLQSRLSRTCRHPIYIYTYLPVSIGVWGCRGTQGGTGGRGCIYRGESSGERWIYPDSEIFASMLSTITHRTSSTEGRAIFQATAGYVYRVTYVRLYTNLRVAVHARMPRESQPCVCIWHDCSRACKRDTDASNFREICHVLVLSTCSMQARYKVEPRTCFAQVTILCWPWNVFIVWTRI